MSDTIWFFCRQCYEEYHLPEDSERCPVCGGTDLNVTPVPGGMIGIDLGCELEDNSPEGHNES